MLTIYPVILQTISDLKPQLHRIERHDRDLGRQMRRAASSIALNVAEGQYSRGRNRVARYHTALGSARETMACLEVAVADRWPVSERSDAGPHHVLAPHPFAAPARR